MKTKIISTLLIISSLLISCKQEKTIDDELKEAAVSMNKLTPQVLSKGIRLDSVSVKPGKIFKYNYTLTDDVKEGVTAEEIDLFKKTAKEGATHLVRTSPDMKEFRDNGVTLEYFYYDKNGKPTADFRITETEYKSK
ncbi:hypothetical protein VUJ46_12950 [Chryseobacterium sp. MYb264]|uniref:hypothetical protein n=1 Tax=Chryseobacterium sp. MYb264 TaxID=2745153 RepID=UPI002E0DE5F1|nr:hypothetical protein VUJ46_12950 [Chryseobacterium sp. MYb264]